MSDTPRTAAFCERPNVAWDGMWVDFARELERENAKLREDATRAGLWAASLSLHLHDVKRAVEAFARGVTGTSWKTNEPRVIGFNVEFQAMVEAVAKPEPALPPEN
jgi:hypothetical protein